MNKDKLTLIVSLFALIFISFYLINNPNSYEDLLRINIFTVLIVVTLKTITLLLNSIFNYQLLKVFNVNLNFFEALYISSVTFLGNFYLPARSGANFRLLYLNKVHALKSPSITSLFFYFVFVTTLLSSFFGIVSLIMINQTNSFLFLASLIFLSLILFCSIYILQKKYKVQTVSKNAFYTWVNKTKKEWNIISSNPKMQFILIFITMLNYFLFAGELAIIFKFLFERTPFFELFYFNSLSIFSSLVSITPASIGIKEAMVLISTDILGLNLNSLISILVIERAVSVVFSMIPLTVLISNSLKNKFN